MSEEPAAIVTALRDAKAAHGPGMARALATVQQRIFGGERPPAKIGRYVLIDRVGRGGMGVVYRAYDPELDRKVAVKIVETSDIAAHDHVERLKREAQALARVTHPNVVAVFDVGTCAGVDAIPAVYVVMELVEGTTLHEWLAARRRSWREIVRAFAAAARGLAAAHAHGIVHRDFKPANAVIDAAGTVRVLDFGLARHFERASDRLASGGAPSVVPTPEALARVVDLDAGSSRLSAPVTVAGSIVGTPRYMPPEQLLAREVDARADQYSLSVAAWEALYGALPFDGAGTKEVLAAKLATRLAVPTSQVGVPAHVHAVLVRALQCEPEARFADLAAWIHAIERDPWVVRRRWLAAAGVLGVTLGVVAGRRAWVEAERSACSADRAIATQAWTEKARAETRRSFDASGLAFAEPVFRWIDDETTRYEGALEQARAASCDALVAGEQTAGETHARAACFDRLAARMHGFIHALREAAPAAVLGAGDMPTLPELSTCATVGRMPPPGEIDTADVLVLEDRLARAATLAQFGQLSEALDLASVTVERADAVGSVDLAARARLVVGRTLRLMGRAEEGERALGDALVAADAANEDVTATHAMVWLADAILVRDGADPTRRAEARRWLELAGARVDRLPAAGPLRALVDGELGELCQLTGDYEGAVRLFRDSIARREASLGPGHPLTASAHDAAGGALALSGRLDEALAEFERGLAVREEAFGPDHPSVARSLNNIATVFERDGRAAEAVPLYERALAIDEEVLGEEHANWATKANNLGYAYLGIAQPGEALVMFERALASQDGMREPLANAMILSRKGRAIALRELGRHDEALVQFSDALELARASAGEPGLRDLEEEFDRTRFAGSEPR